MILEEIKNRRSIRQFKNDDIDKKDIELILQAGLLAPSAHNKQPWSYYVLCKDKKKCIIELINNYITNKEELSYYEKIMRKQITVLESTAYIILCYKDNQFNDILDDLSMGASIENMCLQATSMNIGSLWQGVIREFNDLINTKLNIKDKTLLCALLLGYKNEYPEARPRKEEEETIFYL